ncbi:MAG TPA: chloride channel protein [Planctomycetota bacterium]|nr:chloride channel protein [Planctomycetota bacterium]
MPRKLVAEAWRRLRTPGVPLGLILAGVVGVGAGLGAVLFRWLIATFQGLFFGGGRELLGFLGQYYVILVPAAGGLLVGLIVNYFAKEAKGHGVPEVMLAVAAKGGRIRPRVAAAKILASAVCIGSGGSVGREGPIVQIGSALGSTVGQLLRLPTVWLRTLVGCGASAGISATFNAPLGGCFFTMELLFRSFATKGFAFVVVSAVAGNLVALAFLGNSPAFVVGNYALADAREMLLYVGLGVLTGLVGVAFIKTIHFSENLFEAIRRIPEWVKPVIGGLIVGCIGLYSPDLFGVGYGKTPWVGHASIDNVLAGEIPLKVLLVLVLLKLLATSTTIGSGGSGGVFAPSLFLGAMTGGIVGLAAARFFPGSPTGEGAYALVGAAALFAGVARAPITSVVMIFELTRNYALILPVMTTVVVCTGIVRLLSRETIYTEKLIRRGIDLQKMGRARLVAGVRVGDVMTVDFPTVPGAMSLADLAARFHDTGHHGFPVLDSKGKLCGVVTLSDLREAEQLIGHEALVVADICSRSLLTAYPDETVGDVLSRAAESNFGRIPIVDPDDEGRLLGVLRRTSLVEAWHHAIERGEELI